MATHTKPKSQPKNNTYTVLELKSMAKKRGLKGYSTMRKNDLCILLGIIDTSASSKKLNIPHGEAPVSILKKRPAGALIPVTLHVESKSPKGSKSKNMEHTEIIIYIRPCDRRKLVFPCTIKSGVFFDQHEYDEYQQYKMVKCSAASRDDYARVANIELEKEKKELRAKKKSPKKVKFNV